VCGADAFEHPNQAGTIGGQKAALRRQVAAVLNQMTPAVRAAASAQACDRLRNQPLWRSARSVLFFATLPKEPDLWPLLLEALRLGKTVGLPRYSSERDGYEARLVQDPANEVAVGKFGIREPLERCPPLPIKLDLLLVPGVAFDLHGRRLGRGRGFYDQLLSAMSGTTCGVAFDEQIVPAVPVEPHDAALNCILTPTRWIEL